MVRENSFIAATMANTASSATEVARESSAPFSKGHEESWRSAQKVSDAAWCRIESARSHRPRTLVVSFFIPLQHSRSSRKSFRKKICCWGRTGPEKEIASASDS
jgi:hypothetical protein